MLRGFALPAVYSLNTPERPSTSHAVVSPYNQ